MKPLVFEGLMVPVFTGFTASNELNVDIVPDYAAYLDGSHIEGILVNGTMGEGVSMTTAERKANLEAWIRQKDKYIFTIMVQIGGTSFKDVEDLVKHAAGLKVDALLCLPDIYFYPQTVEELRDYLKDVSELAPNTPLFYYHIPMFTRIRFDVEKVIRECVDHVDTFAGIKFTHNNIEELARCICVKKELICFLGDDQSITEAHNFGCHSQISSVANVYPFKVIQISRNIQGVNSSENNLIQKEINRIIEDLSKQGNLIARPEICNEICIPNRCWKCTETIEVTIKSQ